MEWISDSDDDDDTNWDDVSASGENSLHRSSHLPSSSSAATVSSDAPSTSNHTSANKVCATLPSHSSSMAEFIAMGFSEQMVARAMKENGEGDSDAIVELLLTYTAIGTLPAEQEHCTAHSSLCSSPSIDWDNDANCDSLSEDECKDFERELSARDKKLKQLIGMGFPEDESSSAVDRCGDDATLSVLTDSIYAAQTAEKAPENCLGGFEYESFMGYSSFHEFREKRKKILAQERNKRRRTDHKPQERVRNTIIDENDSMVVLPHPMIGFSLPDGRMQETKRRLPDAAVGPPYFYYENVALAPKGVWTTISRFLYDIEPEFVDSKYFCAAARKRGYIHNLPIEGRFPLVPTPPKTIHGVFPLTKKWWPSWDHREQLNCIQTCVASAKLTEKIRCALSSSNDPPPEKVQKDVLQECKKWNLVWVGLNKVAPMEPDEIELLLGFPKNHTRGISRTERYKSLGNTFQVDTVAYHLSVLKDMFPNGLTVLSLFTGIGGAEVALHRLGIHMKAVVSVEISETNRTILRSWWEQTEQAGPLIEIDDVEKVSSDMLEQMISRFGGFDLVIGGSPCNNLAGSNRHSRDGLEGEQSALFFHYFRILDLVKCIMGKN